MLASELEENREFVGAFFGANPKTDHKSIKSTLCVDSSNQIQIWIFEIHNLSVLFFGKDLKKVFSLTSGFPTKISKIFNDGWIP